MFGKIRAQLAGLALLCAMAGLYLGAADPATPAQRRERADKAYKQGNFKVAYDDYRQLILDKAADRERVSQDFLQAINCLQNLGRISETDDLREEAVRLHGNNWKLLRTAATSLGMTPHFGYLIAGKFERGHHRGGGRVVNSWQRDRVRALQLMQQALPLVQKEASKTDAAAFYLDFANLLLNGTGGYEAWRLQSLTDLSKLPDYEDGWYFGGRSVRGAPVDADNKPIFHHVPVAYEKASSDGQRWRWMLTQAVEMNPTLANEVDWLFAEFCKSQYGVQTLAQFGFSLPDADPERKTGTFDLYSLKETETIARLATGLQRFTVPDEFNWIKIYQRIAARGKSQWGEQSRDALAREFMDRRQYVKAAAAWKTAIAEYGPGASNFRQQQLEQIVGNWGRFEPIGSQPAGKRAQVDFRFRNAKQVTFEARAVKVEELLADVKTYLKNNPGNRQDMWQKTRIDDIGQRLVWNNEEKYLGEQVAAWKQELKPRPEHVDDRITVTTPLDRPGAYLLTAKLDNGNVSRILLWLADTVLIKKQLDGKAYYFVADAITGTPVAKANVEFFGWRMVQVAPQFNQWRIDTTNFARFSDADGQIILSAAEMSSQYQWVVIARKPKDGQGGADRLAYLGFSGVWYNNRHDPQYHATRVFTMTDRPVYRPGNKVQFKAWIRHAKYDQPDVSDFADRDIQVVIRNPKGDKVYEKTLKTDAYAGLEGDWELPKDCTLGVYQMQINEQWGAGTFRVEEYKKPEFEVKVDAPKEPMRLGEQIEATVQAKYYFGAPVTKARVKVKVTRTPHSTTWYPLAMWDWFYGPGYWWYASDYVWYPGWREWGCARPYFPWWGWRPQQPPELISENETEIGPDGTVKVKIDTQPAKELHGNEDHSYSITAEVVDESRRTIVGSGNVIVSRKPFKVFAWVDRGHYRVGDTVKTNFRGLTPDRKPVQGKGVLTLNKITYGKDGKPTEKAVQMWNIDTDAEGFARQQIKASEAGQYRLSFKLTDAKNNTIEGGYVFVVRGEGFDGKDYRFNAIELITDKREYAPGDKAQVLINTDTVDGTVLLFLRPTNGVYLAPKVVRIAGKSTVEAIDITAKDMPNIFVEAVTVHGGQVHTEMRELAVPPEKRILNVEVQADREEYKPGQKATVKVKLTDLQGQPFVGSTVLTVYDRSVEYISGGSNVPEIRAHFWKWRRSHYTSQEHSLARMSHNLLRQNEIGMNNLGLFGADVVEEMNLRRKGGMQAEAFGLGGGRGMRENQRAMPMAAAAAPGDLAAGMAADGAKAMADGADRQAEANAGADSPAPGVEPTIRKNFADTAFWKGNVTTNKDGIAEVSFDMPEQLTGWKIRVWAMGHGTKVGQGEAEVVTKKDLLLRLQAPRFFIQKDECVLSANVHNYLKTDKPVTVSLEVEGGTLQILGSAAQRVTIAAGGEKRVDWRVKVVNEGNAIVRMKAVSDEESDAMQMTFPAYVHGMLKMESFSGVIRPDQHNGLIRLNVPKERRVPQSRLEIRYSPTLAGAMVDALPYLVEYPYGCTEQTLNRFLPTVITQRTLQRMKLDLKDIQQKRTNLNAAEIGDDRERAKGWKRFDRNPVFDEAEVKAMSMAGVQALQNMQCSDGGWGWFSGWGEQSYPHTTAVVVHGLQLARDNDVALLPGVLERGIAWLKNYQQEQVRLLKNAAAKVQPYKTKADNLDALVYMVLADADVVDADMREFLYRDRVELSVYAKAMYGLALHRQKEVQKLAMILENCEQFLQQDEENQTAYLKLPANSWWWVWYDNEVESNAWYLKLLARTSPKEQKTSRLVKYLLNNRKHGTFWGSTRDTAYCIEAFAEYLKNSGEDKPDMTVEVLVDGKKVKEVKIDSTNLFTFDNKVVLQGEAVTDGEHRVEIRKKGSGPVYYNAYLTNFTLEDFITKAGLEVKVNRKYYKLTRDKEASVKAPGARGQALDQKVEKYIRTEIKSGETLKSGDLVEVELEIDSKNDYEYLLFEDPRAAGFEPLAVRSGYNGNEMGAYFEVRDDRVAFFVRALARGKHSVSYRMRAEIPGSFSALPTRASAMYAPELKGNSDEIKLSIVD
jgi:uncharacterized protein YfaS (alpha-2-macroglobulin family)